MKFTFTDDKTGGDLLLFKEEDNFDRLYFSRDRSNKYFTIAWNHGPNQVVTIDGDDYAFPANSLLTLLFDQSFSFECADRITAWQFNREFYCIIDHDREVSCVGFLFSSIDHMFIQLDAVSRQRMQLLRDMFMEEFNTVDYIQGEVLLALLKRVIVYITHLARAEFVPVKKLPEERLHIIRRFNMLVEANYRSQHSVSFYAGELCKSPKTLSNLFAIYNHKSPSQVIQERLLVEAKRLLLFTQKSVKQITYELGFTDAAYFSNFFKKHTQTSPLDFRNTAVTIAAGK